MYSCRCGAVDLRMDEMTRILIIDDDVDSASALSNLLQESGYDDTQVAYSAAGALQVAVAYDPNIIFVDIELPDMSGYDLARLLSQHSHLQRTQLIALTDSGEHPGREHARTSGFARYLVKPVTAAAVQEVMETLSSQP